MIQSPMTWTRISFWPTTRQPSTLFELQALINCKLDPFMVEVSTDKAKEFSRQAMGTQAATHGLKTTLETLPLLAP